MADPRKKPNKNFDSMRVLIIDRHSNARSTLRIILSTLGIVAVHNAATSADVIRQVKSYVFDVIFADYHLEDGRDGQQLLEELRQKHLISLSTIYMVVTAERNYRNVVSVAELSPDDYLIKPFTADQLQSRLDKALSKKTFFEEVFNHLDRSALADAVLACDELLAPSENPYTYDTLRFKGETLNSLGRYEESTAIFQQVLGQTAVPWASMGLAVALRGQGNMDEAETIVAALIKDHSEFLATYDFLSTLYEEQGRLQEAQDILQKAAAISNNNTLRQRAIGDLAVRNNDLETAERAYGKVLERHRGSSLRSIDDYTNLIRVMLDHEHVERAQKVTQDLRRDWRGDPQGELAALTMESLCAHKAEETTKAKQSLDKALALFETITVDARGAKLRQRTTIDSSGTRFSRKVAVDLAHACLISGDEFKAEEILEKVVAEYHEDRGMIAQIQGVFAKTGREEAGKALLAKVNREIVELNNRGVMAARSGDLESAVKMLIEAADSVPNLQFLVNASKAIFTLLARTGWDEEMAERGLYYLEQAQAKDMRNPKVISAREVYLQVAHKFGIEDISRGHSSGKTGAQTKRH